MTPVNVNRHIVWSMNKMTNILRMLHLKWIDYQRRESDIWIAKFEPQVRRALVPGAH